MGVQSTGGHEQPEDMAPGASERAASTLTKRTAGFDGAWKDQPGTANACTKGRGRQRNPVGALVKTSWAWLRVAAHAAMVTAVVGLVVCSPAAATFAGGNGVLLVGGYGGGAPLFSVRAGAPLARPAECSSYVLGTVAPDGSRRRLLGDGDSGLFSPDGKRLAISIEPSGCNTGDHGEVWLARADGSHRRQIKADAAVGWLPNGRLIVSEAIRGGTRLFDPLNGRQLMTLPDAHAGPTSGYGDVLSMSCRGRVALARTTPSGSELDIYTRRAVRRGRAVRIRVVGLRVATGTPDLGNPAWAPDGRSVLFDRADGSSRSAPSHVWSVGVSGGGLHRLSPPGKVQDSAGLWAPNGQHILFMRDHLASDGSFLSATALIMNADGSNVRPLTDGSSDPSVIAQLSAVWSPDSSSVALATDVNTDVSPGGIEIVNAQTGAGLRRIPFAGHGVDDWQAQPTGHGIRCQDRATA
jgi:hypothetical protein